jgi:hypothetical protein
VRAGDRRELHEHPHQDPRHAELRHQLGRQLPLAERRVTQWKGNLLDYSLDASAVYAELLGDGGGHPSTNLSGDGGRIPRVAPFDSDASMLYIKLTLTTHDNPYYGAGMPLPTPGSVCPATLEAVKTWIDQGATSN